MCSAWPSCAWWELLISRCRDANDAHPQVNVDLELPRSWRKFPDMPGLWELCERSLSLVNAAERPAPAEWARPWRTCSTSSAPARSRPRVRAAQGDERTAGPGPAALAGGPSPLAGGDGGDRA